ncbi:MAG: hypothetical protein WBA12_09210, partial [Catalinimonas sp.]
MRTTSCLALFLGLLALASCRKDDPTPEPTAFDFVAGPEATAGEGKAWNVTSVLAGVGFFALELIDSVPNCNRDDRIIFYRDGSTQIDDHLVRCDTSLLQVVDGPDWTLIESDTSRIQVDLFGAFGLDLD